MILNQDFNEIINENFLKYSIIYFLTSKTVLFLKKFNNLNIMKKNTDLFVYFSFNKVTSISSNDELTI